MRGELACRWQLPSDAYGYTVWLRWTRPDVDTIAQARDVGVALGRYQPCWYPKPAAPVIAAPSTSNGDVDEL